MLKQSKDLSYVRVAAAVPNLKVGDPINNVQEMVCLANEAAKKGVQVLVFPELCLTGYTIKDLVRQSTLLRKAEEWLGYFVREMPAGMVALVSLPLYIDGQIFNVAVLCEKDNILMAVPKSYIPNTKEFEEGRWYSPADQLVSTTIHIARFDVPIGTDLLCDVKAERRIGGLDYDNVLFTIGVETCEDLWAVIPPSSYQVLHGATIILNDSASNGLVGKAEYRRDLVKQQSARTMTAYVYSSCGPTESTADLVFDGHAMIAENGQLLGESELDREESQLIVSDVDLDKLIFDRMNTTSFGQSVGHYKDHRFRRVTGRVKAFQIFADAIFYRHVNAHPFVPSNTLLREAVCEEIFSKQVMGLVKRLRYLEAHVKNYKREVSIGVSGGLDSTLALLVTVQAFEKLGWDKSGIIAVTMPGFGTTKRTLGNAGQLCRRLGVGLRRISIVRPTIQHLRAIGHEPCYNCLVCENAQARERTKILMDLGFTIGTGDLSEIAIGWSTYNADQMSMYNVNCDVPKTLVQFVIRWAADTHHFGKAVSATLLDILDTPVSPELLKDQPTDSFVGPVELRDFFLFCMVRYGFEPRKILFLTQKAFQEMYDRATILKWMEMFYRRFFTVGQFKRDASPNGPMLGSICLSQRGFWRMASDAEHTIWTNEIRSLMTEG